MHFVFAAAPRSSIYLQGKDYRIFRVTLAGAENNKGNVDAYLQMLLVLTFPPSPSPTLAPTLEAGSASTSAKDTLRYGFVSVIQYIICRATDYVRVGMFMSVLCLYYLDHVSYV